jgi:hypothetical protein
VENVIVTVGVSPDLSKLSVSEMVVVAMRLIL